MGGPIDNLKNTYRSLIAEHLINNRDCAVNSSADMFSILSKSHSSYHLKELETIYILSSRLSLCKQKKCLLGLNIISIYSPIKYFPFINIFVFFIFILHDIFLGLALLSKDKTDQAACHYFFLAFLGHFIALIKFYTPINIFRYMRCIR